MTEAFYSSDTQFAGLVEAATAAADQEVQLPDNAATNAAPPQIAGYGAQGALEDYNDSAQYDPTLRQNGHPPGNGGREGVHKRKRGIESTTPTQGQSIHAETPSDPKSQSQSQSQKSTSARLSTVHSAAALFRTTSTTAKKWTRPPMSKLYSSLDLSPENFLHLQAAAKAYMLDPTHPERRETVGQRGRGDTDMVKLRLWNRTQEFLDDLGYGARYFGEHVPAPTGLQRDLYWPRDSQAIVKLCLPLLRRMVTNERQRQYASETRRGEKDPQATERNGHDRGAHSTGAGSQSSGLTRKDILDLDTPDLLDDGCVPGSYEGAQWYNEYQQHSDFESTRLSLAITEADFRTLVANIDGHCRLFHGSDATPCNDECEAEVVQRLISWERLYPSDPGEENARALDPATHVTRLFRVIRADLSEREGWPEPRLRSRSMTPPPKKSRKLASTRTQNALTRPESVYDSRPTSRPVLTDQQPRSFQSNSGLTLHINLVRSQPPTTLTSTTQSTRRVHPRLTLPSDSVPDLTSLDAVVRERLGAILERDPQKPIEVRVWLPDGLVRVRDDGEWMVSLLSAGMVDWMDGEVRILVEI